LSRLHMYHRRKGNFGLLLPIARRAEAVATDIADPVGVTASHVLLGASHHLVGNQAEARHHLEAALRPPEPYHSNSMRHFSLQLPDTRDAQISLARTLWLQGFPDQARQSAQQAGKNTAAPEDPVTFCIPFIWGAPLFRWTGDWDTLDENTERLIAHADKHSLEPYLAVADGLKGEVLIQRGEVERGIDLLRSSLASLHADRYELYTAGFSCILAEALAMSGHLDQALTTVEDAIARAEPNGPSFNMPELLRIRGEVLSLAADERGAEECFQRSIALGDRQSSLSWQLRAATSFARLRLRQGRHDEARTMLAETYSRFNEGFDTVDLKAAKQVLDETHRRVAHR
jgi:tetratricopeptide (TPR) repeat protein